jgi:hypothetical protein
MLDIPALVELLGFLYKDGSSNHSAGSEQGEQHEDVDIKSDLF